MFAHHDGQGAQPGDSMEAEKPCPGSEAVTAGALDRVGNARNSLRHRTQCRERDQHIALVARRIEDVGAMPPDKPHERGPLRDHCQPPVAAGRGDAADGQRRIDQMRRRPIGAGHP